ncbi:MAG: glycosyltransferase family 2 protein, partial [Terriglobales bacterium]
MHWQIVNWIAGAILALAWFSRIVEAVMGMPHVVDIARPEWDRRPVTANGEPRVSIIVPARNEEQDIRETLAKLLALDYSNYEVIAVNDRSTDRTGEIMDQVAESLPAHALLKLIHISELPSGWLGKTHAMWTASQQATGDWLLFTDADVLFKPDSLRRAVSYAEAERADHVVLFPRMIMKRPSETMMIAFFQALFVFGHRPWKVADPKARDHMGVGAFNMVRRSVYEAVGTYHALRMEVVDDMKLGKIIKNAGFAQRNVFGEDLISLHWAEGAFGIVNNLTKNFFAVLSFQWWRTVITIVGLGFLNLGPFLGVFLAHGWSRVPYAVALVSLFGIYHGMSVRSAVPSYYFFLHPVSTSLFMYTLLRSMIHT